MLQEFHWGKAKAANSGSWSRTSHCEKLDDWREPPLTSAVMVQRL
jgi:hypothetical protein